VAASAEIVVRPNGVVVLELHINGAHYGDYPISEGHNAVQQIRDMLKDAEDYRCNGILLCGRC